MAEHVERLHGLDRNGEELFLRLVPNEHGEGVRARAPEQADLDSCCDPAVELEHAIHLSDDAPAAAGSH